MSRRSLTVTELGTEAGVDLDEVLVTLWDLGVDHVLNASDVVAHRDVKRARQALGVATRFELRSQEYWIALLGISAAELRTFLSDHGIPMGPEATKLPRGGVSRLKAEARRCGLDPLTGAINRESEPTSGNGIAVAHEEALVRSEAGFEWHSIGHERSLRWLSTQEVETIHFALVKDFSPSADPIEPPGIRSEHLLGSAVFRPQTAFGNTLKYNTVETSAAALLHSLVLDHPFHNGNKRTALVSMLVFLDENGVVPTCNEDELFKLVLQVAQHRITDPAKQDMSDREVFAITEWLCRRIRLVVKGETPIPWRRLRKILAAYGCDFQFPGGVGNRIKISRSVIKQRGWFGRKRVETLHTHVAYGDEGRETDVSTIKKIREDLHLDDIHGVDSHDFYGKEPARVVDFIARYRKTLYRLARL